MVYVTNAFTEVLTIFITSNDSNFESPVSFWFDRSNFFHTFLHQASKIRVQKIIKFPKQGCENVSLLNKTYKTK